MPLMLIFPQLTKQFLSQMPDHGLILEFGVASGASLRAIANAVAPRTVYGFDWFQGLPEPWDLMNGHIHEPTGAFAHPMPEVPSNAIIVNGLFQDTLEGFLHEHKEPIAFIHFDADLYSSTKYILDRISDRLLDGTIFVFDEFDGFKAHDEHEARAFYEFLSKGVHRAVKIDYPRDTAAAFMMKNA
jgi:hypothetical protein